ncbi:putative NADH-flavin reductase [Paenibacillus phyllosphaerae]|uniref:Putative NADH-flavin reductase n=1 Tax=Paenibacillus phyllosphaerae TaxID=274593 RepID=A0A7W5B197_9BACL|nr:SDR family oxidoreductase [Paenibacillus phyllosphaerae]MBB3112548.1 putative NADH-flavin reductase [Paenibacillus phyllosphaerae]
MKLLLLGATGRVGQHLLKLALAEGHEVTALVRAPDKLPQAEERLTIIEGNVLEAAKLMAATQGADAVLSALNTDGGELLSQAAPLLIETMNQCGMKRIITIGTAGILDSTAEPGLLRYQSSESRRTLTRAAEEHHRFYLALAQSGLDWTIVCPTYLPDGEYTGVYRIARNRLPEEGKQISVPDTAEFAFQQLQSTDFLAARVGIAY